MHPLDEETLQTSRTLLAMVRSNEDGAWDRFFALYWPFILGHTRSSGLAEADAKEVAQKNLIAVWEDLADFRSKGKPSKFRS